ncbi:MAG: SufE family protein [bacterium]|jgi:cysteine desulfuration protein SufE
MSNHKNITTIEQELIDDFSLFETWEEKYEYLIDLGKKLQPLDPAFKTEEYKIKGCQSSVWIHSFAKDGLVYFEGDSDAIIVRGLVGLMITVLNGQPAKEIVNSPLDFINTIGLSSHLAQTRSNGLRAMIKQMKLDAGAWQVNPGSKNVQ